MSCPRLLCDEDEEEVGELLVLCFLAKLTVLSTLIKRLLSAGMLLLLLWMLFQDTEEVEFLPAMYRWAAPTKFLLVIPVLILHFFLN